MSSKLPELYDKFRPTETSHAPVSNANDWDCTRIRYREILDQRTLLNESECKQGDTHRRERTRTVCRRESESVLLLIANDDIRWPFHHEHVADNRLTRDDREVSREIRERFAVDTKAKVSDESHKGRRLQR